MGLFYFLGLVVVVVLVCAAALWVIGQLAPNHPPIIDRGVWVLAVVILVLILVQAMGLFSHDVPIPRVRGVKIARFYITPEFLRELLHLPNGTEIVWAGMGGHASIELTITHPDLRDVELVEADQPPLICPTFRREDDVVLLVDWGQT